MRVGAFVFLRVCMVIGELCFLIGLISRGGFGEMELELV